MSLQHQICFGLGCRFHDEKEFTVDLFFFVNFIVAWKCGEFNDASVCESERESISAFIRSVMLFDVVSWQVHAEHL